MSLARAFRTSLVATASNPLTIVSWGAIFAAASTARIAHATPAAAALLTAIGWGSLTCLSLAIAIVRQRLGERGLRLVDAVSGLGVMLFGGLLSWHTVRHT